MNKVIRFFIGLFGLSIVIIVHEFGHFLACKFFGVQTPIFSIGFGPALFALQLGDTVFQIALLPLGGYVEINQQDLAAISYAAKMIILSAGIIFNLLFAFVIFVYSAWKNRGEAVPIIDSIVPDSPAAHSSLQANDHVIAVDEQPIQDYQQLATIVMQSPGKKYTFQIKRDSRLLEVPVTIGHEHPVFGTQAGWLGVHWKLEQKPKSMQKAIQEGIQRLGLLFIQTSYFMATFFRKKGYGNFVGPLGIIAITGQSLAMGFSFFFMILAILSINVAFFNLLPIPFFDGGKMLLFSIEAVVGPLSSELINAIYFAFFIILLIFIFFITFSDIRRLRRK